MQALIRRQMIIMRPPVLISHTKAYTRVLSVRVTTVGKRDKYLYYHLSVGQGRKICKGPISVFPRSIFTK